MWQDHQDLLDLSGQRVTVASQGGRDPKEIRVTSEDQGQRVILGIWVCLGNQVLQGCPAQRDLRERKETQG